MLSYQQMLAEVMIHLITHPFHGYSQLHRAGDGTVERVTLSDGTVVYVHGGDYDCSEAVSMCLGAVGLLPWAYSQRYMWTGNEAALLLSAGFVYVDKRHARVGDVLLRSGHTELVCEVGGRLVQAGFRISENGTIDGRKGDQTGRESAYSDYNPSAWTWCFRYDGPARSLNGKEEKVTDAEITKIVNGVTNAIKAMSKPEIQAGAPVNDGGIWYQGHLQDYGWTQAVRDGQTCGVTGESKRLEAIRITPPEGMKVKCEGHIGSKGWATFGTATNLSPVTIGGEGQSLRIEALRLTVEDSKGRTLRVRTHVQNKGWQDWVGSGEVAGTTGQSLRVEAVQIAIE